MSRRRYADGGWDDLGHHIADILLRQAHRLSVEMILMEAYGHTHLRKQIFGGVNRHMFAASDRPIPVVH